MDWILTDDASAQYALKISETEFRLIETALCNPETDKYMVYVDDIDLNDYLDADGNADENLTSIINGFGYENSDDILNQYGAEANQVMCECVFEMVSSHEGTVIFIGSEDECRQFISGYVKNS